MGDNPTRLSFNPLTGISSILTCRSICRCYTAAGKFQSPDGDFVYSDASKWDSCSPSIEVFQSPDGDFVYSDQWLVAYPRLADCLFQSPDGDFVYSDVGLGWFAAGGSICFNPLTGISSILTYKHPAQRLVTPTSFNPLTGISSILTSTTAY